jgi:hypothetical protein
MQHVLNGTRLLTKKHVYCIGANDCPLCHLNFHKCFCKHAGLRSRVQFASENDATCRLNTELRSVSRDESIDHCCCTRSEFSNFSVSPSEICLLRETYWRCSSMQCMGGIVHGQTKPFHTARAKSYCLRDGHNYKAGVWFLRGIKIKAKIIE